MMQTFIAYTRFSLLALLLIGCSESNNTSVGEGEKDRVVVGDTVKKQPLPEPVKNTAKMPDAPKSEPVVQKAPEGGYPVESLQGLKPGYSTKSDVIKKFGEPDKTLRLGGLRYNTKDGKLYYLFSFYESTGDVLVSIVTKDPEFELSTGIKIGSSLDDLFRVYGEKKLGRPFKEQGGLMWPVSYREHSNINFEVMQMPGSDERNVTKIGVFRDERREGKE